MAWNEFGDGRTFCLTVTFPKDKLSDLTKKALNLGYLEEQESSTDETCFEAFFTKHQVQLPSETIPLFLKPWEDGLVLCLRDAAGVQREDSLCWKGKELCLTDLRNLDDSKKVKDRLVQHCINNDY